MFKIEVALIAGVTHKHPGLLQADGRGKKNKHEHVTGYHYCYHYWCVFLLEAFPQRGSDFSTLGCGNASKCDDKKQVTTWTQIPGFAAPPGGPLARGDAVLVVDGLSWV